MSVDRAACPGQPSVPPGAGVLAHSRALLFWLDPANLAARLAQAGPVFPTRTGPATAFQVNDPALLRKVGSDEDPFRFWGPDPSLREFTEHGVVGLEGAAHRERRTGMRPAFAASRLTGPGPSVQARTRQFLSDLPADRPLDMRVEMSRLVCGLLITCVLNSELTPDTQSKIAAPIPHCPAACSGATPSHPGPGCPCPGAAPAAPRSPNWTRPSARCEPTTGPTRTARTWCPCSKMPLPGPPHGTARHPRPAHRRHGDQRLHPRLGLLRTGPQPALPAGTPGRSPHRTRNEPPPGTPAPPRNRLHSRGHPPPRHPVPRCPNQSRERPHKRPADFRSGYLPLEPPAWSAAGYVIPSSFEERVAPAVTAAVAAARGGFARRRAGHTQAVGPRPAPWG